MDSSAHHKSLRLLQIRSLLAEISPRGISAAELGRRLGISRSGALKNIRSAGELWPEIYQNEDDKLWYIQPGLGQVLLSLTPQEAGVLHLASRLFSSMMPQPPGDSFNLMKKLSRAVESASPVMAQLIDETAGQLAQQEEQLGDFKLYRSFLERIHLAMESCRSLLIDYEKKEGNMADYTVFPLFLEPYGPGRSLYLCAYEKERDRYLTLKTERMRDVRLISSSLLKSSDNSEDMAAHRHEMARRLRKSWGIWGGAETPQRVELLFHLSVARRVEESRWHVSQKLTLTKDGLLWQGEISSPMEMYPWIRSWGPSVEVLSPQWLRDRLVEDLKDNLGIYK